MGKKNNKRFPGRRGGKGGRGVSFRQWRQAGGEKSGGGPVRVGKGKGFKSIEINSLHSKNLYNAGWRLRELILSFPQFESYIKKKGCGEIALDFKDKYCLYALTKYTLKRDFDLNIEFPDNAFIPDIPYRLEFILWIEDLFTSLKAKNLYSSETYFGVELISGSSCVYPLLAKRRNPHWNILATEVGDKCYKFGLRNIRDNIFDESVQLKRVKQSQPLLEGILEPNIVYDFCTYAPLYFRGIDALVGMGKITDGRGNKQLKKKNELPPFAKELLAAGGEVAFVRRLVNESKNFRDRIRLFCVQVGRLSTVTKVKPELVDLVGKSYVSIQPFHYGPSTRYGIAWTFFSELTLSALERPLPSQKEQKRAAKNGQNTGVLKYIVIDTNLPACVKRAKYLLDHMKVKYTEEADQVGKGAIMKLVADKVTWVDSRQDKQTVDEDENCESDFEDFGDIEGSEAQAGSVPGTNVKGPSTIEDSKPALFADLTFQTAENRRDIVTLTMNETPGGTDPSATPSLMSYLETYWKKLVLPNYF